MKGCWARKEIPAELHSDLLKKMWRLAMVGLCTPSRPWKTERNENEWDGKEERKHIHTGGVLRKIHPLPLDLPIYLVHLNVCLGVKQKKCSGYEYRISVHRKTYWCARCCKNCAHPRRIQTTRTGENGTLPVMWSHIITCTKCALLSQRTVERQ